MEENKSRKSPSAPQETHASTIFQHKTMQLCTSNQRPQIMRFNTIPCCLHYAVLDRMAYQGLIIDVHWRVNGSSSGWDRSTAKAGLPCFRSFIDARAAQLTCRWSPTRSASHWRPSLIMSGQARLSAQVSAAEAQKQSLFMCSKLELLDWQVDWAGWTIIFAWDKRARMVTSCLHDPQNFWIISTAVSESRLS